MLFTQCLGGVLKGGRLADKLIQGNIKTACGKDAVDCLEVWIPDRTDLFVIFCLFFHDLFDDECGHVWCHDCVLISKDTKVSGIVVLVALAFGR